MENDIKKKRILAIDDEPVIIRVSVKVLIAEGFDVDVACNGLVAKDMAGKAEYDFYLSDIRTPAMNGMQFYEYLRQEQPGLENRVIFTTGDVMSPEVKTFLSKKNNLFLAKPFTPKELRTIIRKALNASPCEINS
jgi:CheY-like chemotaxis protein